jgi:aldose 1-epimerase
MSVPPSGEQIELVRGADRAVVVEVGGGLRAYDVDGTPVVDGFGEDEQITAARGQVLAPWPNRLHGGRYTWDGVEHEVPLDEPAQGNALHGLVRFRAWRVAERSGDAVTMALRLHPSPPYPFCLDLTARYALTDDGLVVEHTATNVGAQPAPYALGTHPYITVGGLIDDARLTVPAGSWLPTDEQQIPTGAEPVDGTAYDFRTARALGRLEIDYAFTDLERGPDGLARLLLEGERSVEVWADEGFGWLEVFTGDIVPEPERRRRGLGVEPMTAPPNAFVTGEGLLRIEPGDTATHRWGVRLVPSGASAGER